MQRNTLFSILATAAFGIVMAGPVSASNIDWNGKGTDWATAANWVGGVVPVSGDTATFPAVYVSGSNEPVVSTADATVGRVVLASGHTITVTGKTLTLDGTTAHDIDGNLVLSNNNAVLKFSASVTVDGDGEIIGQDDAAQLLIKGITLTNEMIISGRMKIDDTVGGTNPTFLNGATGTVRADASGTLLMESGLTLADTTGAKWHAKSNGSAVLEFKNAATGLFGSFELLNGATIHYTVNVYTEGAFVPGSSNGTIDTDGAGAPCFRYNVDGDNFDEICNDQTFNN